MYIVKVVNYYSVIRKVNNKKGEASNAFLADVTTEKLQTSAEVVLEICGDKGEDNWPRNMQSNCTLNFNF